MNWVVDIGLHWIRRQSLYIFWKKKNLFEDLWLSNVSSATLVVNTFSNADFGVFGNNVLEFTRDF